MLLEESRSPGLQHAHGGRTRSPHGCDVSAGDRLPADGCVCGGGTGLWSMGASGQRACPLEREGRSGRAGVDSFIVKTERPARAGPSSGHQGSCPLLSTVPLDKHRPERAFSVRPSPISTPPVQAPRIIHSSHCPGEVDTVVPTSQKRRPRHRESKELAKGHTDSKRQSQAVTLGLPGTQTFLLGQVSLDVVLGQPGQDDQGACQHQRCLGPPRTMGQDPPGLGCGNVPFSLVPHVVPSISKFEDPCPQ